MTEGPDDVDGPSGSATTGEVRQSWGQVEEGHRALRRVLSADVEAAGLPVQWFEVLARLACTPEHRLPMNKLAATIEMTSGGFTKLVDRLEAAGLVERVPAVDDRRVIFTALTQTGLASARAAVQRYDARLREVLMGAFAPDELRTLGALMSRLREAYPSDDGGQ